MHNVVFDLACTSIVILATSFYVRHVNILEQVFNDERESVLCFRNSVFRLGNIFFFYDSVAAWRFGYSRKEACSCGNVSVSLNMISMKFK